jgi:hypothetical protein
MIVWRPWSGFELQARGLSLGLDFGAGYRAVLWPEVSRATIITSLDNLDVAWGLIRSAIRSQLNAEVSLLEQYPAEKRIVTEVCKFVTSDTLQYAIGQHGTVVDVQYRATEETMVNVISEIRARVDPYGLQGLRIRTLGENCLLCETAQFNDRIQKLLTKEGRLEVFIENLLLLTNNDFKTFHPPASAGALYSVIRVDYTEDGEIKVKAVAGDNTRIALIYLDRPSDAILVFDEGMLDEISKLRYDNDAREFRSKELEYPLLVPAVGTSAENLSPSALEFLVSQAGIKQRIVLLGDIQNFTGIVEEIKKISPGYLIENVSRMRGETADQWVKRTCGLISALPIAEGILRNALVIEGGLQEARDIRTLLTHKSPAELSALGEPVRVEAMFGVGAAGEVLVAGAVASACVFLLVYFRYRRWKISLAVVGMVICELAMTLGATSVLGIAVGLSELGAILLIITLGLGHMIVITDEMLKGVTPQVEVSVGWRASRALRIVYIALFLIIAAMLPIGLLGLVSVRGFVLIAVSGTILALLFTRSFYPRVVDAIMGH